MGDSGLLKIGLMILAGDFNVNLFGGECWGICSCFCLGNFIRDLLVENHLVDA